jgi:hypothetical protein
MNFLMSKLFKFVGNVSQFIKTYNLNKLDKDFCITLLKEYYDSCNTDLYIYSNNFKYIFGLTSEVPIINNIWGTVYLKVIQDYADTYNECISPQQQVSAFHKLWGIKKNLKDSWVSASNNNILNLLTSITLLDYEVEYINIKFKHFKVVKLFPGETLTFPSTFEYSYKIDMREQSVYILFSQLLISPTYTS